ncbi:hypothetical protein CYMTET_24507 [Cymbomonas tetramitiformis]|uniref:Uncharacterized protein n=1 Tax=Cymbomonas tetramitiformis TaxID=36881 RepID=A0AAE0FVX4_9CHLO|nr:hypothetical protein CYMTET_43852 [Cymbomonas tetramitiformis]KAK3266904.1 hypothetical protein CYMTET_24507 [Cymbomonas tetramitiformis]
METHLKKKHGATLTKEAPPISSIFKRSSDSNTVDAAGEPLPTSTDQNDPGNEDLDPASNPLKRAVVSVEDQSTSLSDEAPASRTGLATVVQVSSILTMLTNMRLESTELRTSINDLPNLVAIRQTGVYTVTVVNIVDPDSAAGTWVEASGTAFPDDGKRAILEIEEVKDLFLAALDRQHYAPVLDEFIRHD